MIHVRYLYMYIDKKQLQSDYLALTSIGQILKYALYITQLYILIVFRTEIKSSQTKKQRFPCFIQKFTLYQN